ncbi:MAG: hypothetical protein WCI05_14000, partial [Myxococcales bacterium]
MTKPPITLADLQTLQRVEAPDLVQAIVAFLDQDEPTPDEPLAEDTITLDVLRTSLKTATRARQKKQRSALADEAWKRYLAQPEARISPRMHLAELIEQLYAKRTGPARQALLLLAREAPLVWGIWAGLKRVFKRAEADLDAELFGVLSARFDVASATSDHDVSHGTLIYLRRRAWRMLRQLGKAVPELYPQFVVEVLRAYPRSVKTGSTWVGAHVNRPGSKKWGGTTFERGKKFRVAYIDAWKRSPDPLMLLLETCQCDDAASFAITGLRELFPDVLRNVTPAWLARLTSRPIGSAHDFVVETLEGSPEFHQGKLKALGLHGAVLALLESPSAKARKYAIEYARGHATDLPTSTLVALLDKVSYDDVVKFVVALLTSRDPRTMGPRLVVRLLKHGAATKWAKATLESQFDRKDLDEDFLVDTLLADDDAQSDWVQEHLKKKYKPRELPMRFWIRVLDDSRFPDANSDVDEFVLEQLGKFAVSSIPADWLLGALARDDIQGTVSEWLEKADALPAGLDLERIKGLVFDASKRKVAFTLLGNPKLVSPRDVGLGWLLALARRADPALHDWAHRYLLQHMRPEHFAEGDGAGVARLFGLATGAKEPEAVRVFAQTYLRCHHPKIGKDQAESKSFNIKSLVPLEAYTEERVWPGLWDSRPDVRRFAADITRVELRRWGAHTKVYELGESHAKEVRNLAYEALMDAGESHADPAFALKPEELDGAAIFSMTESRRRSTRDMAMDLIRKHYARIGGAERLGWLMQSADREVRLFAVRLLWERHRPRSIPLQWKPPSGTLERGEVFDDATVLRGLLRRLLFMLPPGRSMEALDRKRTKR